MKNSASTGNYAQIDALNMYYELHGEGRPLVLIHGGGSTIQSTYGVLLPQLAETRQIIAVELQAHGRTADIDRPLSFESDADDVAALLDHLQVETADVMGFSNGGTTALQLAIRQPEKLRRLVLASTTFRRSGMAGRFFEGFDGAEIGMMPQALRDAFLEVNPDSSALLRMFERDVARMKAFSDIPDELVNKVKAPALVINGDRDVVLPQHALDLATMLQNARLMILPSGHGDYLGEVGAQEAGNMPAFVAQEILRFLGD
jgi:pimeloyl-ACP methyl ester carboxylesterase